MLTIIRPRCDFETARNFLEAILPINWPSNLSDAWLFRGQSADHPLVPSLFRDNCKKIRSLVEKEINEDYNINLAERDVLTRFFEIADQRGLVLPDDSQQMRSAIETLNSSDGESNVAQGFRGWNMSDRMLSLMALAQHYGVPTRLLDWSRLPLAAAYFAAVGAAAKHRANLKAQQGVFTLTRPENLNVEIQNSKSGDELQALPLEILLEEVGKRAQPDLSDTDAEIVTCQLQKFALPISEAEALLYLLAHMGVTHSSVYPGYNSIITDIENEYRWAKQRRSQSPT